MIRLSASVLRRFLRLVGVFGNSIWLPFSDEIPALKNRVASSKKGCGRRAYATLAVRQRVLIRQ